MYKAYRIHRDIRKRGDNEETVISLEPLGSLIADSAEEALTAATERHPSLKHQLCIGEYHAAPAPQAQ